MSLSLASIDLLLEPLLVHDEAGLEPAHFLLFELKELERRTATFGIPNIVRILAVEQPLVALLILQAEDGYRVPCGLLNVWLCQLSDVRS